MLSPRHEAEKITGDVKSEEKKRIRKRRSFTGDGRTLIKLFFLSAGEENAEESFLAEVMSRAFLI